jgi:hypothetical protein
VKNSGVFHPEDIKHLNQTLHGPSGAVPPGVDVYGNLGKALRDLPVAELRERATQLALRGLDGADKEQLVEALLAYTRKTFVEGFE